MNVARLTTKGQLTLPKKVRDAAKVGEGDLMAIDVEDGVITMRKLTRPSDPYLAGVQDTLGEWSGPEDDEAWRDL